MGDLAISLLGLPMEVHSSKNVLFCGDFNNINKLGNFSNISKLGDFNSINELEDFNSINELGDLNNINELGDFNSINELGYVDSINELGDVDSINELGDTLNGSLHIKDDHESFEACDSSNIDEVQFCSDLKVEETKPDLRSLSKSVVFPSHDASAHDLTDLLGENSDQLLDMNLARINSLSLPALQSPSELVSAMKGSRKKQGTPREKMTVSWASDVYDPTPTIVSHTVKNKKRQSNKKKGKNKEKAKKSSRGSHSSSSSKDSKQYRRLVGGSALCYRSFDIHETSLRYDDYSNGFDIGSPDSCGGSFLRETLTKGHMSVAQAL